ncbi:hypothetical protein GALL_269180 [mine drainage metagenome]|uniref:Uncharacterized protein n=1 Tax=mine drainage metagenome TaxID=410659 RepID=A0A1J5RGE9_9ZZZZ
MKTTFPPAPFPRKGVTTARLARSFTLRRARGGAPHPLGCLPRKEVPLGDPSPGAVLVPTAVGCL